MPHELTFEQLDNGMWALLNGMAFTVLDANIVITDGEVKQIAAHPRSGGAPDSKLELKFLMERDDWNPIEGLNRDVDTRLDVVSTTPDSAGIERPDSYIQKKFPRWYTVRYRLRWVTRNFLFDQRMPDLLEQYLPASDYVEVVSGLRVFVRRTGQVVSMDVLSGKDAPIYEKIIDYDVDVPIKVSGSDTVIPPIKTITASISTLDNWQDDSMQITV